MKVTPLLAGVGFATSAVFAVIALSTSYWSTTFDGTGSHVSLWELCWTVPEPGKGAVLTCSPLDYANLVASFMGHGVLNEPADAAAAKWPILQASRGCAIGAAVAYLLAAMLSVTSAVARSEKVATLILVCTVALGILGGLLGFASVGLFAFLNSKWSQYKYTELHVGPSLITTATAGVLAIVMALIALAAMVFPTACGREVAPLRGKA